MKESIHRTFGRQAFGLDPGGYHAARPAYPDWVFDVLCERCDLAPNAVTFEIGAGTGTATHRLLELGANPLVAVEPDDRLAAFLRETTQDKALTVVAASFEEAVLEEAIFDLGVSATAFHWLTEEVALTKVAGLLRPGGWWAMVWNVFGDSQRQDPFHEATKELLKGPSSPSDGNGKYLSLSMLRPEWRRWSGPMRSTSLITEPAHGRSSSTLSKPLPSMRPIPTSTSAQTVRPSLLSCIVLHATSSMGV
jgi:SAM-dependent methyltransferase